MLNRVSTDLWDETPVFAETLLFIRDKKKRLLPFRFNRAQSEFHSKRGQRNLVIKARQLGLSTMAQAYGFHEVTTNAGTGIMLAHDDSTTQKLRRIFNRFYDHLPEDFRPTRKRNSDVLITFPLLDSEMTIATAGSATSGRGGTYTFFHGSEAAFWPDPEGIISGALQGGEPFTIIESTANGAQGWFYEQVMGALDGDPTWTLHFFPWWYDPEYRRPLDPGNHIDLAPMEEDEVELIRQYGLDAEQINWRRYKQRELRRLFPQEYPENIHDCFLISEHGFFGDIAGCWSAPFNPLPHDPLRGRYQAGLDWGQSADYTVLSIIDTVLGEQVDIMRINRLRWRQIRSRVLERLKKWNVARLYVEMNSMSTNIEDLRDEAGGAAWHGDILPFYLTRENKGMLLENYAQALQNGYLKLLNIPWQKAEHNSFQMMQVGYNSWTYSAPSGSHDDSIIANMAAWNGSAGHSLVQRAVVIQQENRYFGHRKADARRRNLREARYG